MSFFHGVVPFAMRFVQLVVFVAAGLASCHSMYVSESDPAEFRQYLKDEIAVGPGTAEPFWILVRDDGIASRSEPILSGVLRDRNNPEWRCYPSKIRVNASVLGRVASVQLVSEYAFELDHQVELEFELSLPRDAAVDEFIVSVGDRHIRAILREREEAEQIYAAAVRLGLLASLLTQSEDGIFRQSLGLTPGQCDLRLSLRYNQGVAWRAGWCELSLPSPSSELTEGRLSFDLDSGVSIRSIEGSAGVQAEQTDLSTATASAETPTWKLDEPCVLRWQIDNSKSRAALFLQPGTGGVDDYFMFTAYGANPAAPDWSQWNAHSVHQQKTNAASFVVGRTNGELGGRDWAAFLSQAVGFEVRFCDKNTAANSIASLWARAEISVLLRRLLEQSSPAEKEKVAARIRDVALVHGISSPMTAFLMVSGRE